METPYPQPFPVWSFCGIAHINLPAKKKFYTASSSSFNYFFVSENDVNDLLSFFRQRWHGEQGVESIHKVFNI